MSVMEGHSVARTDAARTSTVWTEVVSLIMPEPWVQEALCAQTDPEAFFPEKGGSTREAKRVCASCDVAAECLEYALVNGEQFGIWGGMSARERRRMRRPANRPEESPEATLRRLHAMGLMDVEIAPYLGVGPEVVGRRRRALGLPLNQRGGHRITNGGAA